MLRDGLEFMAAPHSKDEYAAFNRKLKEAGGEAPNGEGWMMCEWGMDATRFYGGTEMPLVYDPNGKYWGAPFNLLLVYVPADVYDPFEWAQFRYEGGTDVLGPFPRNGSRDLFKLCYRVEDGEHAFMPIGDEILGMVKKWRAANEKPGAKARAVDEYKRFNDERERRRAEATQKEREALREDLRREFSRPELSAAFSYTQSVREAGLHDVPSGFTRTAAGIIAPSHAVAPQE